MHDYGLKRADAAQLAGDPAVAAFFEELAARRRVVKDGCDYRQRDGELGAEASTR